MYSKKTLLISILAAGGISLSMWQVGQALIVFENDDTIPIESRGATFDTKNTGAGNDINIVANQGSDLDGTLRYNATSNLWEYQNNGGSFFPIGTLSPNLTDNITDALDIQEGTNNYFNINTTNAAENISFGNATTNPTFSFLGSGTTTFNGPVEISKTASGAGNDSRALRLVGETSTADRAVSLINESDAGADEYRLRINDNGGNFMAGFEYQPGFGSIWRFNSGSGLRLRTDTNAEIWSLGLGGTWNIYNLANVQLLDGVNFIANGNTTLGGDAADLVTVNGTVQGASPLTFEGATADTNETTFAITDPTADNTITFKNGSGTVAFLSDVTGLGPLTDNITDALDVQEGTNNYFNINTTNAAENISFGNATTNPTFSFLGSGATAFNSDVGFTLGATNEVTIDASTTTHTSNSPLYVDMAIGTAGAGTSASTVALTSNGSTPGGFTITPAQKVLLTTNAGDNGNNAFVGSVVMTTGTTAGDGMVIGYGALLDDSLGGADMTNTGNVIGTSMNVDHAPSGVSTAEDVIYDGSLINSGANAVSSMRGLRLVLTPNVGSPDVKGIVIDENGSSAGTTAIDIASGNWTTGLNLAGTYTTGISIGGATTDITTSGGEDLTVTANVAGVIKLSDSTTIGSAATDLVTMSGTVQGASPLIFEGATADANETTFAITDPSADNTITFQNGSGTVAFLSDIGGGALTDNITDAYDLQEGTNNYININTTNAAENISFGNATTNPSFSFLGSGTTTFNGNVTSILGATQGVTIDAATTNHGAISPLTINLDATVDDVQGQVVHVASQGITGTFSSVVGNGVTLTSNAADDSSTFLIGSAITSLGTTGGDASFFGQFIGFDDAYGTVDITSPKDVKGTMIVLDHAPGAASTATDYIFKGELTNSGANAVTSMTGMDLSLVPNVGAPTVKGLVINESGSGAGTTAIDIASGNWTTGLNLAGTYTTGINIGGATTDITTGTGEDLTVTANGAGVIKLSDSTTIGSADTDLVTMSGTVQGASPLIFEGATADANETTFAITDPSADNTITFQNGSGTVAFLSDIGGGALTDNITDAYDLQEGTNNYININTTNAAENISFGNATTNPGFAFLGSGQVSLPVGAAATPSLTFTGDTNTGIYNETADTVGITAGGNKAATLSYAGGIGSIWAFNPAGLRLRDTSGIEFASFAGFGSQWTWGGNLTTMRFSQPIGINTNPSSSDTLNVVQNVFTSGSPTAFSVTGGAHTTLAAGTEDVGAKFNLSATKQFSTGALATQREVLFQAPTYGFVGASTITDAATLAITGAPVAGTNATITNPMALWVQGGESQFDGALTAASTVNLTGAEVSGGTPLVFEGTTADTNETTFAITDPTADNTITFKNGSGTVAFLSDLGSPGVLTDNTTDAYDLQEGTNNYININTTNSSENIALGNATTNPTFSLLGSGLLTTNGGITSISPSSSTVPLTVKGATGQADVDGFLLPTGADLLQFKKSDNTVLSRVAGTGSLRVPQGTYADPGLAFQGDEDTGFYLGCGGCVRIESNGNTVARFGEGTDTLIIGQAPLFGVSPTIINVIGAANTGLAANTEATDINFNLARTVQFTAGTGITNQRAILAKAPTYAFTAADTITNAATVAITGAPAAGTNATITNPMALWVQSGASKFDDASPFIFEGATADTNETTFAITDPTADNTITFQNGTGTVAFLSDITAGTSGWTDGGTDVNLTTSTDNVGIGGASLGKLSVDGDTDEIQLLVQGNAAQTANLVTFENSSGTDLVTIDSDGTIAAGGALAVQDGDTQTAESLSIGASSTLDTAGENVVAIQHSGTISNSTTSLLRIDYTGTAASTSADVLHLETEDDSMDLIEAESANETQVFNVAGSGLIETKPASNVGPWLVDGGNVTSEGLLRLKSFDRINKGADSGILTIDSNASSITGDLTGQYIDFDTIPTANTTDRTITGLAVEMANGDQLDLSSHTTIGVDLLGAPDIGMQIGTATSPIVFEGATADTNETTFAITDPTADNTITFQNGTGTVAFLSDITAGTSGWTDGGTDVNLTTSTDNVGIGGASLAKLSVDGDTDEKQLLIQGNAAQTNDLAVFENSSGTDIFTIGGSTAGNVITVDPIGSGDVIFTTDPANGSGVIMQTSSQLSGSDVVSISHSSGYGGSIASSNLLNLAVAQDDDADATDTVNALNVSVTSGSGDADSLRGINIANVTAGAATETALNIGTGWDNIIDSAGFDVVGGTGKTTITGSADGTDALVLTAGDILVTDGDLDISGGDFNVTTDAADTVNIAAGAAPTGDMLDITNSGQATTTTMNWLDITQSISSDAGSDGFNGINVTMATNTDSQDGVRGLVVQPTGTSSAGSVLGILIGGVTSGAANEFGLVIESGWDQDIRMRDPTPVFTIKNAGTLSIQDDALNNLLTIADAGTTGDVTATGTLTSSGAFTASAGAGITGDLTMSSDTSNIIKSTQAGLTAFAGGGQASATAITADIAEVATVATGGDSVKLPAAAAGLQVIVTNHGASSMDLFPASGDAINEAAVNTAKAVAADASVLCYAYDTTNWECLTMAR